MPGLTTGESITVVIRKGTSPTCSFADPRVEDRTAEPGGAERPQFD
jgi:hypothetical protein